MLTLSNGRVVRGYIEKITCTECSKSFFNMVFTGDSNALVCASSNVSDEIVVTEHIDFEMRISYANRIFECEKRLNEDLSRFDLSIPKLCGRETYVCIRCGSETAVLVKTIELDEADGIVEITAL